MATLGDIEGLTKGYADARDSLATTLQKLDDAIEALKRQYLPGIKVQVGIAKTWESRLSAAIDDSKELFQKPRTIVVHGVKVGLEKAKGKLDWADDQQVVKLIEKHFPEMADLLIKTKKKPIKKALQGLTVAELKKLGVTVEETGDAIVIKPVDSQIEKLVDKLLKEKDDEKSEEAA